MCLTIFHLRDLGIRIIGMFPFFIGPLLRPFPIQLGQILRRRRLNPARFCQLREILRVTSSSVPPNDGSHRRVGLQGRSVHANRLPIDQSVFRQYLQHPRKHSAMGLQIDQSPRSRYRRMIRCALRQRESQKALQAQRVGAAPGNTSFRVNAFEISDHQHPEIHSRRDARPTHRFALVKTNALLFGELIKLFVLQNFIHPIVEDVPARSWQLSRRDPQWLLPRSFFTHRHRLSSPIATFFTDYGQCWSNYIEYSRLKSRLLPRAARAEARIRIRLIPPSPQASPEFETPARSSLLLPMTAGLVSEPKPSETNATTAGVLCRRSLLACRPTHSLPFRLLRDERERKTQRCIVSCNVFRRSQHLRPCCRSTLDQSDVGRLRQCAA